MHRVACASTAVTGSCGLCCTDSGPVPGELLFRVTTGHVTLRYVLNARLMRPYVHPLNVADFKGIRAG